MHVKRELQYSKWEKNESMYYKSHISVSQQRSDFNSFCMNDTNWMSFEQMI